MISDLRSAGFRRPLHGNDKRAITSLGYADDISPDLRRRKAAVRWIHQGQSEQLPCPCKVWLPPRLRFTPPKRYSLAHIPGDEGWPIIGRTLAILADPKGEVERMAAKHGLVYRSRVLGETSITALGPEANELVLFDQGRLFSSTHGWGTILGRLFPRGLDAA